ncbi:6-hydroxymethylpterin diphosphokinase MptE-like protein [Treponema sp. UBA3813]|uniref:6-hydroxymethylpterin diphosphokinase MptE-like protein n=1 Tax=Treponema sp. UBA3813 TaxID=1947715 RepID=UPI0025ECA2AD|nr:6-hydroxymethylpterin diphosphokinase MptE-like protein [Treponema sp. UBA3813]
MEASGSEIHFENGKNGQLTCSFQGKYLHSKYNPQNEGERFAQMLEADFSPLCVFIIEPALSYCLPALKMRFPQAEICAIRIRKEFKDYDSVWDHVFYFNSGFSSLGECIFNSLSEEKLCSSLVFDWAATKQAFPDENIKIWAEIKNAILKARDVIGTRAFFSKRWLKNSLIFASRLQKIYTIEKGSSSVIIAASGPSLFSSIPFIKKFRKSFFLIAVSSAFMPLSANEIVPDLVISSDGGYWAKRHLDFPNSRAKTIFALEAESAIPGKIFENEKILPLFYQDGIERHLLEALKIKGIPTERNGTVAGTALQFALSITSGPVFLCGLDQAPAVSYQHTQPNALEAGNEQKDFRLRTKESRISSSRFNSSAVLKIYRDWFVSNSNFFSGRVFRLSDNFNYQFSLGKIREVSWEEFSKMKSEKAVFPSFHKCDIHKNRQERKQILSQKLASISESEEFISEVLPMDALLIKREISPEKKNELRIKIKEKIEKLLTECNKLL